MREIFESLGATVNWNPSTRTVTATNDLNTIELPVGQNRAVINGQPYTLDVPATIVAGTTMVPLRFVSESLGATVVYQPTNRLVSINTSRSTATLPGGRYGAGRRERLTIPAGTVIPVRIDQPLSSTTAQVGDQFTSTIISDVNGDQPLPQGTRIVGRVLEVQPKSGRTPGQVLVNFVSAQLPGGRMVPINGTLTTLDQRDVEQQNGRLVAKSKKPNRTAFIGYGAGAGLVVGLFTDNVITGTLIGAAAGYLSSLFVRDKARDVNIKPGTEFGVQLNDPVTYQASNAFYNRRMAYLSGSTSRYGAGSGNQPIQVMVNGSNVNFGDNTPIQRNNVVLVPVEPVLNAADIRYDYNQAGQTIRVYRPDGGLVQLTAGNNYATLNGVRQPLPTAAYVSGGTLYAPIDFLSLGTGKTATWDSQTNTMILR
jgi:hypothetical protein